MKRSKQLRLVRRVEPWSVILSSVKLKGFDNERWFDLPCMFFTSSFFTSIRINVPRFYEESGGIIRTSIVLVLRYHVF